MGVTRGTSPRIQLALARLQVDIAKGYNDDDHPRHPKGSPQGGKFEAKGGGADGGTAGGAKHWWQHWFDAHGDEPPAFLANQLGHGPWNEAAGGKPPMEPWHSKPQGKDSVLHPSPDDKGKPVYIHRPSKPGSPGAWHSRNEVATVRPGDPVPSVLNGVPMKPWTPPEGFDWSKVSGQNPGAEDGLPPLTGEDGKKGWGHPAAGVIIEEPDGRIWLTRPTNGFGGYQHTFPKGTQEKGLTLQQTAIKEAWEETGLRVQIMGVLGDFQRTTSVARYFYAKRIGGSPAAQGWESQALRLTPLNKLHALVNHKVDHAIADSLIEEHHLSKSLGAEARAQMISALDAAISGRTGAMAVGPRTLELLRKFKKGSDADGDGATEGRRGNAERGVGNRTALHADTAVMFEVAPDPNDMRLTSRWNTLDDATKQDISKDVAADVVPQVLKSVGADGELAEQVGGYMGSTNPSLALEIDPAHALDAAKALGHALSQDSMMVVSAKAAPGLDPVGVVSVMLPPAEQNIGAITKIYDELYKLHDGKGSPVVGGFTASHGRMDILNFSSLSDSRLAGLVNDALMDQYDVSHGQAFAAFIEKKDYGYAGGGQQDAALRGSGAGDLRSAASASLERHLRTQGAGHRPAPKGGEARRVAKGFEESDHPRWPKGTPLGGKFIKTDNEGLPLPPEIGSASNAEHQDQANAMYAAAKAGNWDALASIVKKPVDKFHALGGTTGGGAFAPGMKGAVLNFPTKGPEGKPLNTQQKWAFQKVQYAQALIDGKGQAAQTLAMVDGVAGAADLSSYKKIGGSLGGSNPAAQYEKGGSKFYVKGTQGADALGWRAHNEVLASKLMGAAGAGVVEQHLVKNVPFGGSTFGVAGKMVEGTTLLSALKVAPDMAKKMIQQDFAVHAWLANYDVIGPDLANTMIVNTASGTKAVNIDPGGALLYRAQGALKFSDLPYGQMPPVVAEWDSMRDPGKNAATASIYGAMTASQLHDSAEKLQLVNNATITKLVSTYGPGNIDQKHALAASLMARRDWILQQAGVASPGDGKPSEAAATPDPAPAKPPLTEKGPPAAANSASVAIPMPTFLGSKPIKASYFVMANGLLQAHAAGDHAWLIAAATKHVNNAASMEIGSNAYHNQEQLALYANDLAADLESKTAGVTDAALPTKEQSEAVGLTGAAAGHAHNILGAKTTDELNFAFGEAARDHEGVNNEQLIKLDGLYKQQLDRLNAKGATGPITKIDTSLKEGLGLLGGAIPTAQGYLDKGQFEHLAAMAGNYDGAHSAGNQAFADHLHAVIASHGLDPATGKAIAGATNSASVAISTPVKADFVALGHSTMLAGSFANTAAKLNAAGPGSEEWAKKKTFYEGLNTGGPYKANQGPQKMLDWMAAKEAAASASAYTPPTIEQWKATFEGTNSSFGASGISVENWAKYAHKTLTPDVGTATWEAAKSNLVTMHTEGLNAAVDAAHAAITAEVAKKEAAATGKKAGGQYGSDRDKDGKIHEADAQNIATIKAKLNTLMGTFKGSGAVGHVPVQKAMDLIEEHAAAGHTDLVAAIATNWHNGPKPSYGANERKAVSLLAAYADAHLAAMGGNSASGAISKPASALPPVAELAVAAQGALSTLGKGGKWHTQASAMQMAINHAVDTNDATGLTALKGALTSDKWGSAHPDSLVGKTGSALLAYANAAEQSIMAKGGAFTLHSGVSVGASSHDIPAAKPHPTYSGAAANYYDKLTGQMVEAYKAGDLAKVQNFHLKPDGSSAVGKLDASGKPATANGLKFAAYQATLAAELAPHDNALKVVALDDALEMKGVVVAEGEKAGDLPAMPSFSKHLIDPGNSNAKSHNGKVLAMREAAQKGDPRTILAMGFGTNTYAKKQVKLANDVLAAMGSPYSVVPGQKKNSHPGLTAGISPDVAAALLANAGKGVSPSALMPGKNKIIPALTDAEMPAPVNFTMSSKSWVNKANEDAQASLFKLAKAGDLEGVKAATFKAISKETGDPTGQVLPMSAHPSQHVQNLQLTLIQTMEEKANPPDPLAVFNAAKAASSVKKLAGMFPPKPIGSTSKNVPSSHAVGYFIALGQVKGYEGLVPPKTMPVSEAAKVQAKTDYSQMSSTAKEFVGKIQGSGGGSWHKGFNATLPGGQPNPSAQALIDMAKAAHAYAREQPPGTVIYKWDDLTPDMMKKLASAPKGLIVQNPAPVCASYNPTSTKGWGPTHRFEIIFAPGAKTVSSFGSGHYGGEGELTLLPNYRLMILDHKPAGIGKSYATTRALLLPPDPALDSDAWGKKKH